jgi:hypothetical protein
MQEGAAEVEAIRQGVTSSFQVRGWALAWQGYGADEAWEPGNLTASAQDTTKGNTEPRRETGENVSIVVTARSIAGTSNFHS